MKGAKIRTLLKKNYTRKHISIIGERTESVLWDPEIRHSK